MVILGKIVEPYGIAGWVRVHPFADDLAAWGALPTWWLAASDSAVEGEWQSMQLLRSRIANGKLLVNLDGVDDRTQAESLKGWFVGVPREAMPAVADGEYYWNDLIGLQVSNLEGENLGRVSELIESGANDIMVVDDGKTRRLIPFLAHVLQDVDVKRGAMRVDWGRDW